LSDTRAQFVRLRIEFDDASTIGFVGKHCRFVRRDVASIAPRNGKPKHRHVHAEQHFNQTSNA
jgi:hypothetical protein